jgi:hypothetical protein
MDPILMLIAVAIITERLVEVLGKAIPVLNKIKLNQLDIKLGIAFAFGLLFAVGANLDFFKMTGIEYRYGGVGVVVSAIFIMAGSNYIHELLRALRPSTDPQGGQPND